MIDGAKELPKWMAAKCVIEHSHAESSFENPVISRSNLAVMVTGFLGKRSGFPPLHPRCDNGDVIDASARHWNEAAYRLKAFPSEKLTRARDMLNAHEAIVITTVIFLERRPDQTKRRILGEPIE